jgi:hypothetical protein
MVVFVDLEEDDDEPHSLGRHLEATHHLYQQQQHQSQLNAARNNDNSADKDKADGLQQADQPTNNYANLFASALACYPCVQ